MSDAFFNVSGVDPNDCANTVFVWCRNESADDKLLLGSGHIVGPDVLARPPGILVGQFSVTFRLPTGCVASNIVVTDDKDGNEILPNVSITPCAVRA
jgi:hypothetical protein